MARTEFPVTFHQALPDVVRLGLRWRPAAAFELRLHGDHTRWSVLQTQCVSLKGEPCAVYPDRRRRHRRGHHGAERAPPLAGHLGRCAWAAAPTCRRSLELFAGGGYETGATPDETLEPGLIDARQRQRRGRRPLRVAGAASLCWAP